MATGTIATVAACGGKTVSRTVTKTFDHPNNYEDIVLAAGKAATSWVKTDADTAACDLASGHGYSTGKMDVYWTAGMRYDVDVTVAGDSLTLDGGSGDDFPATSSTDVVVCAHQQINVATDGDAEAMLVLDPSVRAHFHFEDTGAAVIADIEVQGEEPYVWHDTNGEAVPLTGNPVTVCFVSNGTVAAGTVSILIGEDSTP